MNVANMGRFHKNIGEWQLYVIILVNSAGRQPERLLLCSFQRFFRCMMEEGKLVLLFIRSGFLSTYVDRAGHGPHHRIGVF